MVKTSSKSRFLRWAPKRASPSAPAKQISSVKACLTQHQLRHDAELSGGKKASEQQPVVIVKHAPLRVFATAGGLNFEAYILAFPTRPNGLAFGASLPSTRGIKLDELQNSASHCWRQFCLKLCICSHAKAGCATRKPQDIWVALAAS